MAHFYFGTIYKNWLISRAAPTAISAELKVELRKGVLSNAVIWPMHAAVDFAHWASAVLK